VFAHDELDVGVAVSAIAPAVFAGTVAISRFATSGLGPVHARTVLLAGALAAAAGAALIAVAPTLFIAGVGLAAAAGGTAVLFPTLLGVVSRNVDETRRGHATSVVTTVSYLGFLVGPVYVGLWADAVGLRGAMVAVAGLGVGLYLLTRALLPGGHRGSPIRERSTSRPAGRHSTIAVSSASTRTGDCPRRQ
jgi:predicted MFS family arabinose efflux permease